MHAFSGSISRRIKHKLRAKNPDLFLYMDNPYVEELFNSLIVSASKAGVLSKHRKK